jgi:hypothetical protein
MLSCCHGHASLRHAYHRWQNHGTRLSREAGGEMAILTKRFFYHEKGNHDETWYYLALDTETGAVYIEHEWAARGDVGSKRVEIAEFLSGPKMTARDNLLKLIGTLVPDNPPKP